MDLGVCALHSRSKANFAEQTVKQVSAFLEGKTRRTAALELVRTLKKSFVMLSKLALRLQLPICLYLRCFVCMFVRTYINCRLFPMQSGLFVYKIKYLSIEPTVCLHSQLFVYRVNY